MIKDSVGKRMAIEGIEDPNNTQLPECMLPLYANIQWNTDI